MADTTLEPVRIDPTTDLAEVPIPTHVGERLQTLYGSEAPPTDAATWIDATRAGIEAVRGRSPTIEDLCTASDGRHVFEAADGEHRQAYVCVLDPLAYPFLTDTPGTVRSRTPVREATVTVAIAPEGVEVSHEDAVVSLGVSDHVQSVEAVTPEVIYRQVCGYIQVFEDAAEYEAWAAEAEAATTSYPAETGVGLAAGIAGALFD